jgi:hypothetical protein
MKVNQSGVIVGNIGMFVIGFAVAGAVGVGVAHLWPVMQLPALTATLLGWVLGAIAVALRDRGKREVQLPSLSKGREYTSFSRTNTILVGVSGILFGFALASVLGGVAGLVVPGAKWPVLLLVLAISVTGAMMLILRGVFGIDLRDKI